MGESSVINKMDNLENIVGESFILSRKLTLKIFKQEFKGLSGKLNYLFWRITDYFFISKYQVSVRIPLYGIRIELGEEVLDEISILSEEAYDEGRRETPLPRDFLDHEESIFNREISEKVYNELVQYIKKIGVREFPRIGKLNIDETGNITVYEIPPPPEIPDIDSLTEEYWQRD